MIFDNLDHTIYFSPLTPADGAYFGKSPGTYFGSISAFKGMENDFIVITDIDNLYKDLHSKYKILGGKLIGAGGGGFLMFYTNNKEKLRKRMFKNGLEEVRFNFDFQGTQIILS